MQRRSRCACPRAFSQPGSKPAVFRYGWQRRSPRLPDRRVDHELSVRVRVPGAGPNLSVYHRSKMNHRTALPHPSGVTGEIVVGQKGDIRVDCQFRRTRPTTVVCGNCGCGVHTYMPGTGSCAARLSDPEKLVFFTMHRQWLYSAKRARLHDDSRLALPWSLRRRLARSLPSHPAPAFW